MIEAVGDRRPHRYTAEEVRIRLENAKKDGELFRDHRGVYHHAIGHSGTVMGIQGFSGYQGSRSIFEEEPPMPPVVISAANYDAVMNSKRRFSIRSFIREGVRDLKGFFQKKGDKA